MFLAPPTLAASALARASALGVPPAPDLLLVSVADQRLHHFRDGKLLRTYVVSTSAKPPSCVEDSHGTPSGLHFVCERIGDGVPLGGVFKARVHTGEHFTERLEHRDSRNLITTRILRLRGLEPGLNSGPGHDTYDRVVYLHGTNREELVGQPASHGCVLLGNADMLALHDDIPVGALVWFDTTDWQKAYGQTER